MGALRSYRAARVAGHCDLGIVGLIGSLHLAQLLGVERVVLHAGLQAGEHGGLVVAARIRCFVVVSLIVDGQIDWFISSLSPHVDSLANELLLAGHLTEGRALGKEDPLLIRRSLDASSAYNTLITKFMIMRFSSVVRSSMGNTRCIIIINNSRYPVQFQWRSFRLFDVLTPPFPAAILLVDVHLSSYSQSVRKG